MTSADFPWYYINNITQKDSSDLREFGFNHTFWDTDGQRENFYSLVERGQDAIDGILQLSKETEHPRAYEVAGQLIKTVGETAEKLIDLQQKLKKLEDEEQKVGTQHNHLYVGSTSELQKFLKKNK